MSQPGDIGKSWIQQVAVYSDLLWHVDRFYAFISQTIITGSFYVELFSMSIELMSLPDIFVRFTDKLFSISVK